MKRLAALAVLLAGFAVPAQAGTIEDGTRFLKTRELPSGGFAEPGELDPAPGLTAWAMLALRAAGSSASRDTRDYLQAQQEALSGTTDVALSLLARAAYGERPAVLIARLRADRRPNGAIGPATNSTIWSVLALRQAGEGVPRATARYLLGRQTRSGGWSWTPGGAPDSNDTAAAVQALRALGVRGRPIARGLAYLRRLQNGDGGFELTPGRGSDTQSTAWAIQAFLAAGAKPGARAYAYLLRMRRPDGSFRYSARFASTPVWVTAQALPALARKPFPLR